MSKLRKGRFRKHARHILHSGPAGLEIGKDLLTLGAGRLEVANHVEGSWRAVSTDI